MVVSAIVLLTVAVAVYVSPLLRVQKVEVVGATTIKTEEVLALAALEGDSMLRLDTSDARNRIGYLPMVQSVTIERRWPQTVRIVVQERQPWGFWQVGADVYVIDGEGVVLAEAAPAEGAPVVNDLGNPVRLVPGDRVDRDAVSLTQTLLQRVPETLATSLTAIEFSPDRGLVVNTDSGYRVVVGDSQNMDYKLAVWLAIEERLGREAMVGHVLDLRFEDRPSFQ
jgi:cell division protein FtsQ